MPFYCFQDSLGPLHPFLPLALPTSVSSALLVLTKNYPLQGWYLLTQVSVPMLPPQRSLSGLWGGPEVIPSFSCHFTWHILFTALIMVWNVCCEMSVGLFYSFVVPSPASCENRDGLCFAHRSERCLVLGRPLANIYWTNKRTRLERVEAKYQWLKIKWPYLCVSLNP